MSAPKENKKRDYSCYDQMSTAELEQLLRLDFQASKDGESDLDAVLYISDLLAKRSVPSDASAAWEQFQTQYRPYADGRSLYDFDEEDCTFTPTAEQVASLPPARPRRILRLRWLAILAALIVCLLGGMAAAQAAGVDVFGALARWTDETFHFTKGSSTPTSDSEPDEKSLGPIQSVLQPLGMDGLFPTWYPVDVTPWEPRVTDNHSAVAVSVLYKGEDRSYSVVIQHFTQPTDNTGTFEKDNTPVEEYVHNGQVFYILSNLDTLTATTFDGEYMTIIAGALTREEIKAIIDSIPGRPTQNREQMRQTLANDGQPFYCPQIPEGFQLVDFDLYTDPITGEMSWTEGYMRGDQFLGLRVTNHKGDSDSIYEKDDSPVEEYVFHGITHYIFSNLDSTTAAWMVNHVEYSLWASDGAVDMKALIRSAYQVG